MMGHNICSKRKIWKIALNHTFYPFLAGALEIYSYGSAYLRYIATQSGGATVIFIFAAHSNGDQLLKERIKEGIYS